MSSISARLRTVSLPSSVYRYRAMRGNLQRSAA